MLLFLYKKYFVILIISIQYSCKEDDSSSMDYGDIIFNMSILENGGREENFELKTIVLSVSDIDGNVILEDEQVEVSIFGNVYKSEPISIEVGTYFISKFIVLDGDMIARYATPMEGSDLAYLVNDLLPIEFFISKDEVTNVTPEVVSTDERSEEDFGYGVFGFEIVETFDLLIAVFAFDASENSFLPKEAQLTVLNEANTVLSRELYPVTNKVILPSRFEKLTLVVENEGYDTYNHEFELDSLKKYDGTNELGPLEITLDSSVDLSAGLITFYPFNGNANDESGNGNHGAVNGATLTNDRLSNSNSAYYFDGINDYIDLGNSDLFSLGLYDNFSISVWIQNDTDEIINDSESIFSKYVSASDNRYYNFYFSQTTR